VVLSLGLVAAVVVAVTALTAEGWQAQADGICWDYGNQYLAASGTALQQARTRLAVSQQALSVLEQIDVPLERRPQLTPCCTTSGRSSDICAKRSASPRSENRPSASMGNSPATTSTYTSPTRMHSG
jgi:hypothetical protein